MTTGMQSTAPMPVPDRGHPEYRHAVIWIDHFTARIIGFDAETAAETVVHPADPPKQLHHHSGSASGTHITDEPEFYGRVATAAGTAGPLLLCGPSSAKHEFVAHLKRHAPAVLARIAVIQTMERVTDPQLVAAGRLIFAMRSRRGPEERGDAAR